MINPHSEFQIDHSEIQTLSADSFKALWTVPSNLTCFEGHFPEQPILPAVAIIDATIEIVRKTKNENLILKAVRNAKFLNPIGPTMVVDISITELADNRWKCHWRSGDKLLVELDLLLNREIFN